MYDDPVPKTLRSLRLPGTKYAALAEEIGVHRGTVAGWFKGSRSPTAAHLVDLLPAMGTDFCKFQEALDRIREQDRTGIDPTLEIRKLLKFLFADDPATALPAELEAIRRELTGEALLDVVNRAAADLFYEEGEPPPASAPDEPADGAADEAREEDSPNTGQRTQ